MCDLELSKEMLMQYLDGVADASVAAHIVACRECRDSVAMLAKAESRFRGMVSPTLCVGEMRLGEYYLGTLDVETALSVSLHVQICDACRARLDVISQFSDGIGRAPVIAYPAWSQGAASFGLSAVRDSRGGSKPKKELTYHIQEAEINLEVQKIGGKSSILGLVTGIETDEPLTASLRRAPVPKVESQEAKIDVLGDFQFSGVPRGEYELLINGNGISFLLRGLII